MQCPNIPALVTVLVVVVPLLRVGSEDEQMCGFGMRSSIGSWR